MFLLVTIGLMNYGLNLNANGFLLVMSVVVISIGDIVKTQ